MARPKEHNAATATALLEAAERAIEDRGVDALSVRGVASDVGVSTRAVLSVYRAAQARAVLANRAFVVPDDIKTLAVAAMSHRVIAKGLLRAGQRSAVEAILSRLIESVAVPT